MNISWLIDHLSNSSGYWAPLQEIIFMKKIILPNKKVFEVKRGKVECIVYVVFYHPQWLWVDDSVCPWSSDPFYIVSYCIKWVITSWTHSIFTIASTIILIHIIGIPLLSVPKFTENLYCICLSIPQIYT